MPSVLPGFRHVQLVVVEGRRARAYGIGHRTPRSCPVSIEVATKLAREGVRVVVKPS